VECYQWVAHRNVCDVLLIAMLDVTCIRSGGRLEESFDHLASDQEGVAMFTGKFRDHCPDVLAGNCEGITENPHCAGSCGWAVDQRDHRRVPPVVEHRT